MNTTNNTILIIGSSAGIGLSMAKQLSASGNHVIMTGRNEANLLKAAAPLKNVTAIVCDVTSEADVDQLISRVEKEFPNLNVIINNAGHAVVYSLASGADTYQNAKDEMETNFFSIARINDKILPLLSKQKEAAIVNVSSVVALVPGNLPTYSASKAALHSYTLSLRHTLADTNIKVFELMPPLVNTEFSAPIGGANGISPDEVAEHFIKGFAEDTYEIHSGKTAFIYDLFRKSPEEAFAALNAGRAPIQ
ncbi:MAG: SDR family NAD(P)-dependent oxidoreductase [Flavipsychrobacter sp.]|nr:SDR family NAD(P)-dependent oxidoreductase [Flavipsychrobacter sp.]